MSMPFRLNPLAAVLIASFASPVAVAQTSAEAAPSAPAEAPAAETAPAAAAQTLPTVKVEEQRTIPYQATNVQSAKYTEPLRDTPQNITVLSKELLEAQNALTLRQILTNVPGVTFGAGEGGGGFGDNITLRGYNASGDITIDGVRNSAQTTRSDPFNLEQIEIFKGPNTVYGGAGGVSGGINMVSKTPFADDSTKVSTGIGTDNYRRTTLDTNQALSGGTAVRVNAMVHENQVSERDVVEYNRWGIAPSVTLGMGGAAQLTLGYFHQQDDNIPDYGIPFRNFQPVPGVDRSKFFGYRNIDREEITNDAATATVNWKLSEQVSLRNLTRYAMTDNLTVVTGIGGRVCETAGQNPLGGAAPACAASGTYETSGGPRGHLRDTNVGVFSNQTDFTWSFKTGAVDHTLVTGFAFSAEDYARSTIASVTNTTSQTTSLYDPELYFTGTRATTPTALVEADVDSRALYAFDTMKFGPKWLLSLGLRYEHFVGENTDLLVPANNARSSDDIFSGRIGLVFKPVEIGSFYLAYGNSANPAAASLIARAGLSAANDTTDPERTFNYEAGTKWDLIDGRLSTTLAVFRNEKDKVRVASPIAGEDNVLAGESRVDGTEISVSGELVKGLNVYAAYAWLDTNAAVAGLLGVANVAPPNSPLVGTPEHSGNVWASYALPFGLELGYGAQYVGTTFQTSGTQDAAGVQTAVAQTVSSYLVHSALIGYKVNRQIYVRLNAANLTNEDYYTSVRGNVIGWGTPGEGRSFILTADYNF